MHDNEIQGQEEHFSAPPQMDPIALTLPLAGLPETVTINGLTYRREDGNVLFVPSACLHRTITITLSD